MDKSLTIPKDKIADFCRSHHINWLGVFGSALRDDFSIDSDVDILVEFKQGFAPGFAFFGMQDELSEMLGRKVDLNTPGFLSKYFRDKAVSEAEVQYGQN